MSLIEPPNHTPVRSAWEAGGWGSPLYHQDPTAGLGLRGWAPRPCATAGVEIVMKTAKTVAAVPIEISERLFVSNLLIQNTVSLVTFAYTSFNVIFVFASKFR